MYLKNGKTRWAVKYCPVISLVILVIFSVLYFTYLCWRRHKALFNYEYIDLAAIINICWNTSEGRILYQTINPNSHGIFLLHIQPIILLLSFFFSLFKNPVALYFGFNFALAIAVLPLYFLARRILNSELIALGIATSYLFYAPLKSMYLLSDPDPVLLSVPFIFLFFYFLIKRNYKICFISALLILACGEYLGLLVSALGIHMLFRGGNKKLGMVFSAGGIIYTFLSVELITLAGLYNRQSLYCFLKYDSFMQNLKFIIFHPVSLFYHALEQKHFLFLSALLKPLLFLPLFSWEFPIFLPIILQIFLCKRAIEFGRSYYAAPLVPLMFISLTFFLRKIMDLFAPDSNRAGKRIAGTITVFLIFSCIFSNFTPNIIGYLREDRLNKKEFKDIRNIYDRRFYESDEKARIAWELINLIPSDSPVMATADLCPSLSVRKTIYYFPYPYAENKFLRNEEIDLVKMESFLDKVKYLLINYEYKGYGAGEYPSFSVDELERALRYLLNTGRWEIYRQKNDFTLLIKK